METEIDFESKIAQKAGDLGIRIQKCSILNLNISVEWLLDSDLKVFSMRLDNAKTQAQTNKKVVRGFISSSF
jgi:hypothetical protein